MDRIGFTIKGAKEISSLLKTIERKESAKIARKSTRESNKEIIAPALKQSAVNMVGGRLGGLIANAVAVRAMTKMRRGNYGSKVILKDTDALVYHTKDGHRFYIPSAIEYGHAFPGRGRGKNPPKDVAANPFARTVYEANAMRTIHTTTKKMWKKLGIFISSNTVNKGATNG